MKLSMCVAGALAGIGLSAVFAQEAERIGSWEFVVETDEITNQASARILNKVGRAALRFQCDYAGPDSVYAAYFAPRYLGALNNDSKREVRYQVDDRNPVTVLWSHRSIVAFDQRRESTRPLTAAIAAGRSVVIRASTYDYEQVETRFSLDGTQTALDRLYQACEGRNAALD